MGEDTGIVIAIVVVILAALLVYKSGMGATTSRLRIDIPRMLPYRGMVINSAKHNGIDDCLLAGVIERESAWKPNAVNPSDPSYGIAQVMLPTANEVRPNTTVEDLYDPKICIEVAARYIHKLNTAYKIPMPEGIDAYNVGPGNWKKGNRSTVYREAVLRFAKEMCK